MISLRREQSGSVTLERKLAAGGQGTIYTLVGESHLIAKIYHKPTPEYAEKLKSMLASPPNDPTRQFGHIAIAWPTDRLFDAQGTCIGFLMPYIGYRTVPLLKLYNQQDRLETLPNFTWRYLLHTAVNLASIVAVLHAKDYIIGDLNESNILVSTTALVTLVDCDSMQVPRGNGQVFRSPVGKGDYTPPELQGRDFEQFDRATYHDNFGLAVLIFQMLMEGRHPFDVSLRGVGKPLRREEHIKSGNFPHTYTTSSQPPRSALSLDTLPPPLQTLMLRCFVDGHRAPQQRPTAKEWYQALSDVAEQQLTSCQINRQHWYSQHLSNCPWCARMRLGIPDPFPPYESKPALPPPTASLSSRPLEMPAPQKTGTLPPPGASPLTQTLAPGQTQSPGISPLMQMPAPQKTQGVSPRRRAQKTTTPRKPQSPRPPGASPRKRARKPGGVPRRRFLRGLAALAVASTGGGLAWWILSHHSTLSLPYSAPSLGTTLYTYYGHAAAVLSVTWSPDSTYIASGSADKTVQVWDASTGTNALTYSGHADKVVAVSWSPDGQRIASASSDSTVQVWDALSGQQIVTYGGHSSPVFSVAWSPDGKTIASGGNDTTVQVWDATLGQLIFTYRGHSNWIGSLAWSPDGQRIASASADRTVQVWDATTGRNVFTYRGHADSVWTVAWSPDGQHIASGGMDTTVQVWNAVGATIGHRVFTYRGHSNSVEAIVWSSDGQHIASASDDTTVQVWNALASSTGHHAFIYHGHMNKVWAVAWSPDGQRIASGSDDKTVQVWQAA